MNNLTNKSSNKIINPDRVTPGGIIKELLTNFCIGFTLLVLFSCIFGLIFADEAAKPGILMCISIGVAMFVCAVLQLIFFTPVVFKRMSYPFRLTLFGVSLYIVLALYGAYFNWFPADNAGAWVAFTLTYLVILALMSIIFTLINKRETKALNDGLADFKSTQNKNE